MDIRGFGSHSPDRKPTSPVLHTSDFLFVNETSDSPTFKHGENHDVRSHVRKHVLNRSKQLSQWTQTGPRYLMLAPQIVHDGPSKAPPDDRNGLTEPFAATEEDSNQRQNPLVSRKMLSNTDVPAIRDPPTPTWLPGITPECAIHNISGPHQRSICYKNNMDIWRNLCQILNPSPLEILGAGRKDPFLSCPIGKPEGNEPELIDHAITCLLPGLMPDNTPSNGVNASSKIWFSYGLSKPLVFHALVFASQTHLDFLRWSKILPNSPHTLAYKLIVIQKLNQLISEGCKFSADEVILAISILASHESMDTTESGEKRRPFNSPLRSAQWLEFYGNMCFVPEHAKAAFDLISLRGGLESLELQGLAELIVAREVKTCMKSFSKPVTPQLQSHEDYIAALLVWATSSPCMPQATAFKMFQDFGITDMLLQSLECVGAFTIAIDHYLQSKPGGLSLATIVRTRPGVQKRLLLLPLAEDLGGTPLSRLSFYECCRLTLHIYGLAIVLPIPNAYNILQTFVTRLKTWIEVLEIDSYDTELDELLLWMLTLGGIAALDKPERPWFALNLAIVVKRLNINWDDAGGILEKFLWLESACGPGGQLLWSEAVPPLVL